ncbi:MAG: slipin family protein [Gemmataceae bacterium]
MWHRERVLGGVTIYEYERGLLYRRGRFQQQLEPGRYRLWPFLGRRILVVDIRRTTLAIVNQKLMTADPITVTLNVAVDYELANVVAAMHQVKDYQIQLYNDAQLAAREVVGGVLVDELLRQRQPINARIQEALTPVAQGYGVRIVHLGIKDVILAAKVRDMLMKEEETKRLAQAALIGAREEVATLRALANAARLAAEQPELLSLRELEVLRAFAQTAGHTVVVGMPGFAPARRHARHRDRRPPSNESEAAE